MWKEAIYYMIVQFPNYTNKQTFSFLYKMMDMHEL